MDLSRSYDYLLHSLLIVKLESYGHYWNNLNFMLGFLTSRKQRTKIAGSYSDWRLTSKKQITKIASSYSDWTEIFRGIPPGSILGKYCSINIFFFVGKSEICDFADDNTLHSWGNHLPRIKCNLIYDIKILWKCFRINSLKSNPRNFQFMILDEKTFCKYTLVVNWKLLGSSDNVMYQVWQKIKSCLVVNILTAYIVMLSIRCML